MCQVHYIYTLEYIYSVGHYHAHVQDTENMQFTYIAVELAFIFATVRNKEVIHICVPRLSLSSR